MICVSFYALVRLMILWGSGWWGYFSLGMELASLRHPFLAEKYPHHPNLPENGDVVTECFGLAAL